MLHGILSSTKVLDTKVLAHGQELKVAGHMPGSQRHLTTHLVDFWLARGGILVIVGLQIGIVNDLTVGPRWFAPCLELVLLHSLINRHCVGAKACAESING